MTTFWMALVVGALVVLVLIAAGVLALCNAVLQSVHEPDHEPWN